MGHPRANVFIIVDWLGMSYQLYVECNEGEVQISFVVTAVIYSSDGGLFKQREGFSRRKSVKERKLTTEQLSRSLGTEYRFH